MKLAKTNKYLKKTLCQNLEKQKQFNNRYTLTKQVQIYDSFTDPHTSYYFSSPAVMSNLKHLQKVIARQRNSSDKKKLQLVLRQRNQLNMKLTSIFKRRTQSSSKTQEINSKQLFRQTLGSLSLYYQKKKQQESYYDLNKNKSTLKISNIDAKQSVNPQNSKQMKELTIQQEYSNRLAQNLHNKKRMKWINYLEERKNALLPKNKFQTHNYK